MKQLLLYFIVAGIVPVGLTCQLLDEPESVRLTKLDSICKDDLSSLVDELPDSSICDSVYYSIVELNKFANGTFIRRAVVDYFYLKNVAVKLTRNYRYHRHLQRWERYSNTYVFLSDSMQDE